MRLFISYTTRDLRDRALAQQIADGLTARAVNVFFAPQSLRGGAQWKEELRAEIGSRCSHILVIVSAASVNSEEVREEIDLALARAKGDPSFKILPLVTGLISEDPLSQFHRVEYSDNRAEQVDNIACLLGLPPQTEYEHALRPVVLWGGESSGDEGELVPRLCDRREQERSFRSAFNRHMKRIARSPQVYFISGAEGEKHGSLVDRFRWTFMNDIAAQAKGDRDASVSMNTVPWPVSTNADEATEELLSELFGAFDSGYLTSVRELTPVAFQQLTRPRPEPVVLVQHEIRSKSWNRATEQVIERYLRFWSDVADLKPAPQFVIFFNLVVCDSDEHNAEALTELVGSFTTDETKVADRKPFWKTITSLLGSSDTTRAPLPKNIAITPLPPLQAVRREDVDDWFDQRFARIDIKKRQKVCDDLFQSAPVRRMADVERRLAAIFNDQFIEGRA